MNSLEREQSLIDKESKMPGYKMSPSDAVCSWNEMIQEKYQMTETKTMHFVIDDKNADIGIYDISLKNSEGKTVPGTEVTLWDYANEYQITSRQNNRLSERERSWKQRWTWCDGWSHSEVHTWEENLSNDQVITEIQQWISEQLLNRYQNALETVCQLQPIIKFMKTIDTIHD